MGVLAGIFGFPRKDAGEIGRAIAGRLMRFASNSGRVVSSLISEDSYGNVSTPGQVLAASAAAIRGVVEFDSSVRAFFGHVDLPSDWHAVAQKADGTSYFTGYKAAITADNAPAGDVPVSVDVQDGTATISRSTALQSTPLACAVLEVQGAGAGGHPTGGFMPPRLTTVQRDAIPSPTAGLTIYNSTSARLELYDGAAWVGLTTTP
jgi:hypothetical protein